MNLTVKQPSVSFEQYVAGQFDCPWSDCLWVDGELVEVPPESGLNNAIARYLFLQFSLYSISNSLQLGVCHKDTDIEVKSTKHRTHKPDVMVLSPSLNAAMRDRSSVIRREDEPPLMTVEVVSKNYRDIDLVEKAQEYLDRAVQEYWTVEWDRVDSQIIVRTLDQSSERYISQTYRPGDIVQSEVIEGLRLTVDDILKAE